MSDATMSPVEILAAIDSGSICGPATFEGVDCDAVIDALDASPAYEAEWLKAQEAVDQAWERAAPGPVIRDLVERIRKHVFFAVSKASNQHDIASYVSDDFDLIVRARIVGVSSGFLERLWSVYQANGLPSPRVAAAE
jgi:hypothetical protein